MVVGSCLFDWDFVVVNEFLDLVGSVIICLRIDWWFSFNFIVVGQWLSVCTSTDVRLVVTLLLEDRLYVASGCLPATVQMLGQWLCYCERIGCKMPVVVCLRWYRC